MRIALLAPLILACLTASSSTHASEASWPLEYRDESTNRFIGDKRTRPLIQSKTHLAFAAQLADALGGPPGPVDVRQDRYFTAHACVPHACLRKGFFWLDVGDGSGLGAIFTGSYPGNEGLLALDSRQIRGAIPENARRAIIGWLAEQEAVPTSVELTDATGIKRSLPVALFTPPQRFVPPSGGPSFDCAHAGTTVEHTLCDRPELAVQDLTLSTTYRSMLNGLDTMPARRQLIDLQKQWIEQRNLACEHATLPSICLSGQYSAQWSVLQQWLPVQTHAKVTQSDPSSEFGPMVMEYRGQRYSVVKQRDANEHNAAFNKALAGRHLAQVRSCSLLVDVPVGTAHGNHSYGGICTQPAGPGSHTVMVCDDDMIGHFGLRPVGKREVGLEDLAQFVAEECYGG